jgi:hypothetical protein
MQLSGITIFALSAVTLVSASTIPNANGGSYFKRDIGITSDQPDTSRPYTLPFPAGIILLL